uniref:S-adenosylmethionine:tRNA ribosyltransferase-isomerase n=1 Tax=Desulfobacca acetoxidans TaxID=60893 RepID=A0A7V4G7C5_9BACT
MTPALDDYDYHLPSRLIAQHPPPRRDASRLMVLDRRRRAWDHTSFAALPQLLDPRDLLVLNDTRVFPARLVGRKASGGKVALLLHHIPQVAFPEAAEGRVRASCRGRLRPGQVVWFGPELAGEIVSRDETGAVEVVLRCRQGSVLGALEARGLVPLPPYIRRQPEREDMERYQTVYAATPGAVAAPTAGLHFTPEILAALEQRGIERVTVTLHVGPGTFQPVRTPDYTRHRLLPEYFRLSPEAARRLNAARAAGQRLVAVGTTTVRVLEHCAGPAGFTAQEGWCDRYIYPGYRFQAVDRLLTNFHLPRSTLLLLVSAFADRELILAAYEEAVRQGYRFYSYGDCMLIV